MNDSPYLKLIGVFAMALKKQFPEHIKEIEDCQFSMLDGNVYMWYEPRAELFMWREGQEKTCETITQCWVMACKLQKSVPVYNIRIFPNN